MQEFNVLLVSDDLDKTRKIKSIIDVNNINVFFVSELDDAVNIFDTYHPFVVLYDYESVLRSKNEYIKLLKNVKNSMGIRHSSILLCHSTEVTDAYNACVIEIFNDYLVSEPDDDLIHINLLLKRYLDMLDVSKRPIKKAVSAASSLSAIGDDIDRVLDKHTNVKRTSAKSFAEMNQRLKNEIQQMSARLLKRVDATNKSAALSSSISEEISHFSDDSIPDAIKISQSQIDNVVNTLGSELNDIRNDHGNHIDDLKTIYARENKHILVVEDNVVYSQMLSSIIKSTGTMDVTVAATIHNGVSIMMNDRPDLVILDYELPDADASDFLEKIFINDDFSRVPVIMLTSHSSRDVVNTVLTQGAVDYLIKPANRKLILEKIRKWL